VHGDGTAAKNLTAEISRQYAQASAALSAYGFTP